MAATTKRVERAAGWTAWRVQRVKTPDGVVKRFISLSDGRYHTEADAAEACQECGPGKYRLGNRDGSKQVKLTVKA